jgi:hypothetical protein
MQPMENFGFFAPFAQLRITFDSILLFINQNDGWA